VAGRMRANPDRSEPGCRTARPPPSTVRRRQVWGPGRGARWARRRRVPCGRWFLPRVAAGAMPKRGRRPDRPSPCTRSRSTRSAGHRPPPEDCPASDRWAATPEVRPHPVPQRILPDGGHRVAVDALLRDPAQLPDRRPGLGVQGASGPPRSATGGLHDPAMWHGTVGRPRAADRVGGRCARQHSQARRSGGGAVLCRTTRLVGTRSVPGGGSSWARICWRAPCTQRRPTSAKS
jgi:hypothetical protein